MEYKLNELNSSEQEVEVSFAYDEIKKEIETEVRKQTKNIQMPGFRKGKVPLGVLKKMYGDALEHEASEKVANTKFWDVAKEKELKPIGQPQLTDLKFNPGDNLSFKVKYEVIPEIEVKDYTDQEIEVPILEVRDEDINHEIEHIIKANSTQEVVEEVGDDKNYILKVDLQRIDEEGNPFKGSKTETIDIDLSNPGIQTEIIENSKGKKVNEFFNFTFNDEHAHKDKDGNETKHTEKYDYKADIKEIKKVTLPELNEELIKKVTKDKVSTEDDLRAEIKKDIQTYYDQRTDELVRDKLLKLVVEKNDFRAPEAMVHNILNDMIKREEEEYKKQGYKNVDKGEISKRLHPVAELEVKWYLIKEKILKKEDIKVTDEDLQELVKADAIKTGLPEDKLMAYYKSANYNDRMLDNKLFEFLKEKNTINKVDPEKYSQTQKEIEEKNDEKA